MLRFICQSHPFTKNQILITNSQLCVEIFYIRVWYDSTDPFVDVMRRVRSIVNFPSTLNFWNLAVTVMEMGKPIKKNKLPYWRHNTKQFKVASA